ncbi:MAG: cytochrome C oxidase subunit IV family protein [Actinomycetota bacterium]|jgi:cytochrome c oxidase subunit 4
MSQQVEAGEEEELHSHPEPRQYIKVAIFLAVVTAVEVAIYYVPALRALLVPILIVLAVIKFLFVARWFMHLRFDSKIFQRFFVTGVLLAMTVFAVVLLFYFTHGGPAPVAR